MQIIRTERHVADSGRHDQRQTIAWSRPLAVLPCAGWNPLYKCNRKWTLETVEKCTYFTKIASNLLLFEQMLRISNIYPWPQMTDCREIQTFHRASQKLCSSTKLYAKHLVLQNTLNSIQLHRKPETLIVASCIPHLVGQDTALLPCIETSLVHKQFVSLWVVCDLCAVNSVHTLLYTQWCKLSSSQTTDKKEFLLSSNTLWCMECSLLYCNAHSAIWIAAKLLKFSRPLQMWVHWI